MASIVWMLLSFWLSTLNIIPSNPTMQRNRLFPFWFNDTLISVGLDFVFEILITRELNSSSGEKTIFSSIRKKHLPEFTGQHKRTKRKQIKFWRPKWKKNNENWKRKPTHEYSHF